MIDITIKNHLGVLISSIDKIYKKAQMVGKLESKEIYYLNIIYKLLNNLELTNSQNNELITFYNKLSYYSKNICPPKVIKKYQTTITPKFQQLESNDCNTYPKNKNILYWQENYILNNSQITTLIDDTNYLIDKPSDTYENFEIGKNIEYSKIGKIIFLALESNTTNYQIKDNLNNDVTHTFNIQLVPVLNATLFISDNIYSYGTQNFKIIKL
jgi:hypothetical protein